MNRSKQNSSFVIWNVMFTFAVLCAATGISTAQTAIAKEDTTKDPTVSERVTPSSATKDASTDARLRNLEDEVRQQKQMLTELREIIADQRRLIEGLAPRAAEAKETAADSPSVNNATDTATQTQTNPLEDRVKKLEGKVLSIGPFRFSGDFRLRYDGIFRKADNATPTGFAPLTHAQNSRMRYRLRFNFDTDIDPKVSFHGQLATGPVNNALTMDQDFGETAARHPFFISEAWIDYHPNKATQLQAGRLQEIFADNSRFLFDDDIRFNGFNEKYVLSFKRNGFKAASLELRAGQYILSNPNVAIVTAGSPLALAGDKVGSTGPSLFQDR